MCVIRITTVSFRDRSCVSLIHGLPLTRPRFHFCDKSQEFYVVCANVCARVCICVTCKVYATSYICKIVSLIPSCYYNFRFRRSLLFPIPFISTFSETQKAWEVKLEAMPLTRTWRIFITVDISLKSPSVENDKARLFGFLNDCVMFKDSHRAPYYATL